MVRPDAGVRRLLAGPIAGTPSSCIVVAPADGQSAGLGGLTVAYRDTEGENSRTWSDHLRFGPGC